MHFVYDSSSLRVYHLSVFLHIVRAKVKQAYHIVIMGPKPCLGAAKVPYSPQINSTLGTKPYFCSTFALDMRTFFKHEQMTPTGPRVSLAY